jgi:hypothetical protein
MDAEIHTFLTSALVGGEWSASHPGHFNLGKIATGTEWVWSWLGPRASLDGMGKRKFLALLKLKHRPLGRPVHDQSLQWLCYPVSYNNLEKAIIYMDRSFRTAKLRGKIWFYFLHIIYFDIAGLVLNSWNQNTSFINWQQSVGSSILTVMVKKSTISLDIPPSSPPKVNKVFRGTYRLVTCFHTGILCSLLEPEHGSDMFLQNVSWLLIDYMVSYSRRY